MVKYNFNKKTKKRIIYLYVKRKLGCREIGSIFNVGVYIINSRLRQWEIHIRNHNESQKGKILSKKHRENISKSNKGRKCWCKGLTKEINDSVRRRSEKLIGRKSPLRKEKPKCKVCGKTLKMENKSGFCIKHIKGKNSPRWVGDYPKCKCCGKTLRYRKHIYCIDCIRISENSPNWKGGISLKSYPKKFNNNLKEKIRKRDNYRCQQCFRHQDELFYKDKKGRIIKYKLQIHHIDYNKNNSHPSNLISLCNTCHSQTNFKRKDWVNYFKNKMEI